MTTLTRNVIAVGSAALLCLGLLACKHADQYSLPHGDEFVNAPIPQGNRTIGVVKAGSGIACWVDGYIGQASYAVADIGSDRAPRLRVPDAAILHVILRYVHPDALRFAYVQSRDGTEFILFQAPVARLCDPDIPPFFVLNGACNEYYMPLNSPDSTTATPDCFLPPRPWVENDPGVGTGCTWSLDSKSSCG